MQNSFYCCRASSCGRFLCTSYLDLMQQSFYGNLTFSCGRFLFNFHMATLSPTVVVSYSISMWPNRDLKARLCHAVCSEHIELFYSYLELFVHDLCTHSKPFDENRKICLQNKKRTFFWQLGLSTQAQQWNMVWCDPSETRVKRGWWPEPGIALLLCGIHVFCVSLDSW